MMTKEEFFDKISLYSFYASGDKQSLKELVNEFFKDKIIIQRGENRHPYAAVLHEWVEGNGELQHSYAIQGNFKDIDSCTETFQNTVCRIKPKEPIYEWQYLILNGMDNENHLTSFYTDEEFKATRWKSQVVKIQETKRERKQ